MGLFLCHFYLPYVNLIPSGIFRFPDKEDERVLRLRLIIKNNVRCVEALAFKERLTEL